MVIIESIDIKIGLEVHIPITSVETKLFCSCPNTSRVKPSRPNQYVCPTCMGLPGSLPQPNKKAIYYAIRAAKVLNSKISDVIQFYRKHYFYPDLPKGYQITQYSGGGFYPLGVGGYLRLSNNKIVRIRRVQIEEDPAKLIHPSGLGESDYVLIDYNRSGNPLIEVVTEPDIKSPEEARKFLEKLIRVLKCVGVLDPDIDAVVRCDANISLGGIGRIEIKNIGSPKDVEKALRFEIIRLRRYLEEGLEVGYETRHWDDRRRVTISIREKEYEAEYRYFPDPNIPRINIKDLISEALRDMPKTEDEIYDELTNIYSLPKHYADLISKDIKLYKLFTGVIRTLGKDSDNKLVKLTAKIITNHGYMLLRRSKDLDNAINTLTSLIELIESGLISEYKIRDILTGSPREAIKSCIEVSDSMIEEHVRNIVKNINLSKSDRVLDYIVGRIVKEFEARGYSIDPRKVASITLKYVKPKVEQAKPTSNKLYEDVVIRVRPYEYYIKDRISGNELNKYVGEHRTVCGWIETIMDVGSKLFLIIRDWYTRIQCVIDKRFNGDLYKYAIKLPRDSYVAISGLITRDFRAPGGVEIRVSNIKLLSGGLKPAPLSLIDLARSSIPIKIRYRYLDLRRFKIRWILKFRYKVLRILRRYLEENGFIEINTPKIITAATEGGAELFPILFYGVEAFLAQSPQLYKQMALNAFEKVYEIASYYRAQKFDTPRHLAEFWSLDIEAAFYNLNDLLDLIEDMLIYLIDNLNREACEELNNLSIKLPRLLKPFPRIEYENAVEIIRGEGVDIKFGDDLGAEELNVLARCLKINTPFFIIYWPRTVRAFYYRIKPDDDRLTLSFDLLWPLKDKYPLELASGGERINNSEELITRLREKGLYPEAYTWYIDMFKYGMPPHGGFGLGVDRLIMALLNLDTIIDAVFIPRTPKYSKP